MATCRTPDQLQQAGAIECACLMSSRPRSESPIPPPNHPASSSAPMTDIERPRPAGLALPPPMPSFRLPTYHPHDPSTRNLPPIYAAAPNILPPVPARLPQPSPYYSTPQASPVSSSTGGIERWSAAPLSRLLSSPPRYTPPRSESSLSPGYALSVPSRAEGGARGFEGPPLSKRPR